MKISELSKIQKEHLAWRLHKNTACGLLTAIKIADGKCGDFELVEVFQELGQSMRSAKILATKVKNFKPY
jgi:hypothetical protein